MSSAGYSVNRVPKWFRNIAGTIILITGGYWSFHGLTSGLSMGLGLGGVLVHIAVPGLIFLFSAAVAWCWRVIGGVVLVIEGLIAFFIYCAYLLEWGISLDSIFVARTGRVGPRQLIDLMNQFLKKEADFGLRMAVSTVKLP